MRMVRCEEGVSTRERIAVTSDVFGIVGRLKEIDDKYFVMLNRESGKFEVHVRGQEMTLGCELPFDELDARAIEYVREHHSGRIKAILREMEEQEAQIERENASRLRELSERMADGLRYVQNKRTTDDFPDEAAEGLNDESERTLQYGGRIHRQERRLCNHHGR